MEALFFFNMAISLNLVSKRINWFKPLIKNKDMAELLERFYKEQKSSNILFDGGSAKAGGRYSKLPPRFWVDRWNDRLHSGQK